MQAKQEQLRKMKFKHRLVKLCKVSQSDCAASELRVALDALVDTVAVCSAKWG